MSPSTLISRVVRSHNIAIPDYILRRYVRSKVSATRPPNLVT